MAAKRRSSRNKPHPIDALQVLAANLKPVPFLPLKNHTFFVHGDLLKRLGLWDFANLDFDALSSKVQPDLVSQLIASFNPAKGYSFVNGGRVSVCLAELTRALKLPEKIVGGFEGGDAVTKEMIRFVEDFVFDWIVLRGEGDEAVIVPNEIPEWVKAIREGCFEKVDWAGMVWFMVEEELMRGRELKDCYYCTHMMCLIQSQTEISNLCVEEANKSVQVTNPEACKAKIEDPNSVADGEKTVIDRQNETIEAQRAQINSLKGDIKALNALINAKDDAIEAQKALIVKLENGERSNKANAEEQNSYRQRDTIEVQNAMIRSLEDTIEAQNVLINAKDVTIEAQKAFIVKLENGEGSNKTNAEERNGYIRAQKMYEAKIVAQEKEYKLMMKLLKGYQEALKRTQMEFREFREKCACKNLHEPIYRDVPGTSGLVLSVGEIAKRSGEVAIDIRGLKL